MNMLLNIIVLIFEILYYSLFMKFAKNEGKLWKYILSFSIVSIFGVIINTANILTYILLSLIMALSIKYIVKVKTSLYDMLLIIIMLFTKFLIELIVYILLYQMLSVSHFGTTLIFEVIKVSLALIFKDKLYKINNKLNKLWVNNNFYIRYFFSILLYGYIIISILLNLYLQFIK